MAIWKDLFKPWILVRGREYFECGQVVELKEVGTVVTAEVSGSKAYQVEISCRLLVCVSQKTSCYEGRTEKGGISAGMMREKAASQTSEAAFLCIENSIRKARSVPTENQSDYSGKCRSHHRNYGECPSGR